MHVMRACDDVRRDQSTLASSSAGCVAREHRVVFDLAPFEHFTRVFYGPRSSLSTRVGGCAFTRSRVQSMSSKGGLELQETQRVNAASKVTTPHLPGSDSARAYRKYDLLRCEGHKARIKNTVFDTLGGRWVVATLKTRGLCHKDRIFTRILHLGYCLNRVGLLSVQEIQKRGAVRDNAFTLAMTRHIFVGLEREDDVGENEQTLVVETLCTSVSKEIKRRDASSSAIIAIERAILLARAIARTAKFAPVQPVGSSEDARLAREMNKQKSKYGEHLVRELRQKVSHLRGESIQSQSKSNKSPRQQKSTQQVAARPPLKRRSTSQSQLASASANKRARRKSTEPLVLKLKEPKVVIPAGVKRATAFGRDITNVTSEKTKRVVQSVSKAAAGFVRRQMSVKRSR